MYLFTLKILILCSLQITQTQRVSELQDYCKHSVMNIPCYRKCKRDKNCGITQLDFKSLGTLERQYLEDEVNYFRNRVAGGKFYAEPPAQDMFFMKYDEECEWLAGCVLKTCSMTDVPILISRDGTVLGYNGYGKVTSLECTKIETMLVIEEGLMKWIDDGISNISYTQVIITEDFLHIPYEFLQLVWSQTRYFGCAIFSSRIRRTRYHLTFACVFKPAIRIHKRKAYTKGEPGAMCDKSSLEFPNLCWHQNNSTFVAPVELNKGFHAGSNILSQLFVFSVIYLFNAVI